MRSKTTKTNQEPNAPASIETIFTPDLPPYRLQPVTASVRPRPPSIIPTLPRASPSDPYTPPPAHQTPALVRRAVELRDLYGISFWDSSIVSAAESRGCREIVSEDLNAGQFYNGAVLVNPSTA